MSFAFSVFVVIIMTFLDKGMHSNKEYSFICEYFLDNLVFRKVVFFLNLFLHTI